MAGPHNPSSAHSAPLTLSILRRYALAFLFLAVVSAVAGFEVGRIKAAWANLLIANADPEDAKGYIASGMCSVVEKPIKPERLLAAMNAALEQGGAVPAIARDYAA